jgi:hypothetical protein
MSQDKAEGNMRPWETVVREACRGVTPEEDRLHLLDSIFRAGPQSVSGNSVLWHTMLDKTVWHLVEHAQSVWTHIQLRTVDGNTSKKAIAAERSVGLIVGMRNFYGLGRPVFEFDGDLAEVLLGVECNHPVKELAVPYSSFYIQLPEKPVVLSRDTSGTRYKTDGIFVHTHPVDVPAVSEKDAPEVAAIIAAAARSGDTAAFDEIWRKHARRMGNVLTIESIVEHGGLHQSVSAMSIMLHHEESIETFLERFMQSGSENSSYGRQFVKVARLALNLCVWLSSPESDSRVTKTPLQQSVEARESAGSRISGEDRKAARHEPLLHSVGRTVRIDGRLRDHIRSETESTRVSPRTHWRRGHWHRYWTGPVDGERKLVSKLLAPVLVQGAGVPSEESVYKVS